LDKGTDEDLFSKPSDPNKISPKKAGLKQSLPFLWMINKICPSKYFSIIPVQDCIRFSQKLISGFPPSRE